LAGEGVEQAFALMVAGVGVDAGIEQQVGDVGATLGDVDAAGETKLVERDLPGAISAGRVGPSSEEVEEGGAADIVGDCSIKGSPAAAVSFNAGGSCVKEQLNNVGTVVLHREVDGGVPCTVASVWVSASLEQHVDRAEL
jgi:hypothetical protein